MDTNILFFDTRSCWARYDKEPPGLLPEDYRRLLQIWLAIFNNNAAIPPVFKGSKSDLGKGSR